ncbi:hypothetical protein [Pararhizobium sp. PWRC1-1]|uniref:hypothetical protein n=1 Tax=Pararhizobium sp. PWRC1-1 TaxID=2804566 RepID=UPI003CE776A3
MDRRTILTGFVAVGAAPIFLFQTRQVMAATSAASMPAGVFADVKTAAQFYSTVIGRAEISLATSQIASEKATQKNALEFAGFELGEAITVNMVLKDTGAMGPGMDASADGMVEKVTSAAKGKAFDKAYIALQLENHEYLRDLADAFIHNSTGVTDPAELQGRHLSMLMLAVFKEHVAICKRISNELGA